MSERLVSIEIVPVASYRNRSLPDLLLYRKRSQIPAFLDDDAVLEEQRQQKRMVEDFIQRWLVDSNAARGRSEI